MTFPTDINECDGKNNCSTNEECRNEPGSYECPCKDGYERQNGNCVGRHTYPLNILLLNRS